MTTTSTPQPHASGTTTFRVPDMTCGHCVATVRGAFGTSMPGTPVEIDLSAHLVRVTGDAATAQKVLAEAGYPAEPIA